MQVATFVRSGHVFPVVVLLGVHSGPWFLQVWASPARPSTLAHSGTLWDPVRSRGRGGARRHPTLGSLWWAPDRPRFVVLLCPCHVCGESVCTPSPDLSGSCYHSLAHPLTHDVRLPTLTARGAGRWSEPRSRPTPPTPANYTSTERERTGPWRSSPRRVQALRRLGESPSPHHTTHTTTTTILAVLRVSPEPPR